MFLVLAFNCLMRGECYSQNGAREKAGAHCHDVGALGVIGYQGEVYQHAVCRQVRDFIGSGRKGREIHVAK
jgi:hypothetical protein